MADIRITPASSIMSFTSSLNFTEKITQDASGSIVLQGSGSTGRTNVFAVDGNSGRLFSIDDDLSDSLFSVNTIAGLPVIEAFANNSVNIGQYSAPPIKVTGSLAIITGSLLGTASYATQAATASWATNVTNNGVTSVSASGTVSGITLGGGPITSTGTLTLSGTVSGLTNSNLSGTAGITNANLANSSVTVGSTSISLGSSATTIAGLSSVTSTTFVGALTGNASTATSASFASTSSWATSVVNNGVTSVATSGTVSGITLTGGTITSTGTITLGGSISGLTNANLSGTAGITNANLANSAITVGSTSISLGSSATTIAGLSSVTSTTFVGALTGNASTATTASFATLAANSSLINSISSTQIFNNMGQVHSTRTAFDASTPSYDFGFRFIQGANNGPAAGGGSQFYSWYIGLGSDYLATGAGSYGMQVAIPRAAGTPYMSVRYNEANSLGSWIKIAAGFADTATSASYATNALSASFLDTLNQDVTISKSGGAFLSLGAGSYGGPELRFLPNSTAGFAKINVGNGNSSLDFQMNSATKVTLNQSGHLGVGTTSPTSGIHVVRDAAGPVGYTNLCAVFGDNTASGSTYTNSVGVAGRVIQTGSRAIYGDASTGGGWAGYFDGKGYFSGNVGIGIDSPHTKLHIEDVTKTLTSNVAGVAQGTLSLVATDAQAADVGASLVFGGNYINSSSTRIAYAGITGRKSNSSSVNADGYLSFLTWRSTGLTEAMRITAAGDVGIGVTSIQGKLHVAQNTNLGGTAGNNLILQTLQNTGGSGGNLVYIKDYAVRDATGTDWTTWRHHNSIDIDGVYNTPGTNTRTFWERDPFSGIHYFGNSATTTLTVDAGNNSVGVGGAPESGVALMAAVSNNAFGSTAVLNNTNSGTSALAQLQLRTANQPSTPFVIHQFNNGASVALTNVASASLVIGTNNTTRVTITSGGAMGLGGITPTNTNGRFEASNDIVAYSSSDKNWKINIKNIDSPLEKLSQINGVEFDWIEDEPVHGNKGHDVGVIAQEIEQILPEAVQTRESGMKAVKYEKIIPLLIEAIKDQQKQIDELKQIVNGITS